MHVVEGALSAGWFLFERRRYEEALAKALEALAAEPEDLEAHYLAGLCHASEERLGEAESTEPRRRSHDRQPASGRARQRGA